MKWFVRGDIDGFFGLALDNLIQILLIIGLCSGLLGFPDSLVFGSILPGVAVSMLIGNIIYSWMAVKLGRESGRNDVCALPYGINTPSVFIYVFLVMFPVKLKALSAGIDADSAARHRSGIHIPSLPFPDLCQSCSRIHDFSGYSPDIFWTGEV